ncbi:MAG: YeeE/YedE family protein [Chitinophagales bacterium]|nr:YeeE/YedE family protein [Chitinophagales bacterium]
MMTLLTQSWSWWFSGLVISSIMFLLLFFGKSFGFSANLRTICAAAGAGKHVSFFNFNWKAQTWNLIFLVGAILGGFIAATFMSDGSPAHISENTIRDLAELGFSKPESMQPAELYDFSALMTGKGFLILALGGLMVGFGSRYAGGCTSGHAISGLSNLQLPSLMAVIGFFIGGLLMTHVLFPFIF